MQLKHRICYIRFNMSGRTEERDYIQIVRRGNCQSKVGKIGGRQDISLGDGCASNVGIPIHEFMHALGKK